MISPHSKPKSLMVSGLWLIALRSVIQTWFDRAGHASGLSDFLFGALLGIGLGLTLLGMWRERRGQPGGPCAR